MKSLRRRLTFNLTPLLDVILLMVFAYQIQSLQQVEASEKLRERANVDMDALAAENERLRRDKDELQAALADAKAEADAKREPSALAETLNEMAGVDQVAIEVALAEASQEDRAELRKLMERMSGRPADEVLRELAKLESYSKYISSWFIYLEEDRGYEAGISLLRVVVDDASEVQQPISGSDAEVEESLHELLRNEVGSKLARSQRLVVLRVIARCQLYKDNKDRFVSVLQRVFRSLRLDTSFAGTEFIFAGEETQCRN